MRDLDSLVITELHLAGDSMRRRGSPVGKRIHPYPSTRKVHWDYFFDTLRSVAWATV